MFDVHVLRQLKALFWQKPHITFCKYKMQLYNVMSLLIRQHLSG